MKTRIRVISNVVGIIFCLVSFFLIFAIDSKAEIVDIDISGKGYVFEDSDDYEYEGVIPTYSIENGENAIGKFYISGSELSKGEYIDGVESYGSDYGVVSFIYDYDILKTNLSEKLWHITKDTGNDVGDIELEDDIGKGVIIIQASMDGKKWITESVVSDFFSEEKDPLIYETSDIQLINGCFFRILIAYRQEITVDASIFGVSTTKDANRKMMELYKFYLYSTDDKSNVISAGDSPRKELGTKVNAGKDTGYSEMNTIELDDPHYGWDIGTFCVNGYTREEKNDTGTPVFLKNLGDRVTLWFSLKQDIECLNGNEKLSIEEDSDGYDLLYEIAKTNFGHGTLIIQYTDYEGKKSDPIVYTDYLLANARTGADTKVTLFEEGDYDVALDYSIKDESGVFPKYTNYKISFSFAVRNSNCMVFPFDLVTGSELSDGAITKNGFMLDMAKSRYLTIDVQRKKIIEENGIYKEDVRVSSAAKDGSEYTDEGVYIFTVNNKYTGDKTTKTIYVGDSNILRALSNGIDLSDINKYLSEGATIDDNGNLIFAQEDDTNSEEIQTEEEIIIKTNDNNEQIEETSDVNENSSNSINADSEEKEKKSNKAVWLICSVVVIVILICIISSKKKKRKNEENQIKTEQPEEKRSEVLTKPDEEKTTDEQKDNL